MLRSQTLHCVRWLGGFEDKGRGRGGGSGTVEEGGDDGYGQEE